jgi:hypothetical protein
MARTKITKRKAEAEAVEGRRQSLNLGQRIKKWRAESKSKGEAEQPRPFDELKQAAIARVSINIIGAYVKTYGAYTHIPRPYLHLSLTGANRAHGVQVNHNSRRYPSSSPPRRKKGTNIFLFLICL